MKILRVESDYTKYYVDFLFGPGVIRNERDEQSFINEYNYTLSELDRLNEIYTYERQDTFDLGMRLQELNKIAEDSEYKIEVI